MATIPLFPLSNALFPAGVLHLRIFEVRYLDMIRRCIADGSEFGVVGLLSGQEVRTPEGVETLAQRDAARATEQYAATKREAAAANDAWQKEAGALVNAAHAAQQLARETEILAAARRGSGRTR